MKCDYKKINEFFDSKLEPDIKDFVIKLLKYFCKIDDDILVSKIFLYAINCYTVEDSDNVTTDYDDDKLNVIDFYKLSKLNVELRKFVIKCLFLVITDKCNDFMISIIKDDLKVLVTYKDWKLIERKNKLEKLNDI